MTAGHEDRTSRRAFLLAAVAAGLSGCAAGTDARPGPAADDAATTGAPPPAPHRSPTRAASVAAALARLERASGRRIGCFAVGGGTGHMIAYRADERFAMCSTYKTLAVAAVLAAGGRTALQDRVRYPRSALVEHSPVTSRHVGSGLTVAQLCAAALQVSDNTAANLLVQRVGGPGQITAFVRRLEDPTSRLDRSEPDLNTAVPDDPRDTSTPRWLATDHLALVAGDALPPDERALLRGWLETSTTGRQQIRSVAPQSWRVGDRSGAGSYGSANDVAVLWPPGRPPVALAVLTRLTHESAPPDPALVARVARVALTAFR